MSEVTNALTRGIAQAHGHMKHTRGLGESVTKTTAQARSELVAQVRRDIAKKKQAPRDATGHYIEVDGTATITTDDGSTITGKVTRVASKITVDAGGKKFKATPESLTMVTGADGGEPSVNADLADLSDKDLLTAMDEAEAAVGRAVSPRDGGQNIDAAQGAQDRINAISAEADKRGISLDDGSKVSADEPNADPAAADSPMADPTAADTTALADPASLSDDELQAAIDEHAAMVNPSPEHVAYLTALHAEQELRASA